MKKVQLFWIFLLLLCLCSCSRNNTIKVENNDDHMTGAEEQIETVETPLYFGTWEITGVDKIKNSGSNSKIIIAENGIIFRNGEEEYNITQYIESYDSSYTYIEFEIDSYPFVLVQINEDMIGLFTPLEDGEYCSYRGTTPWGMEFDAEIPVFRTYMRQNAGTKTLPSYISIEKLVGEYSEFSDHIDYIYYPNAQVLQLYGYGLAYFYVYTGGGAEYMEAISLNLRNEIYNSSDIFTDAGFVITDNR